MKHSKPNVNNQQDNALRLVAEQVSQAVWLGETDQLITSLVKLANYALDSGYVREKELIDLPGVGSVSLAMKLLFGAVERCSAGMTESYSELYGLCTQLTHMVLNAKDDAGSLVMGSEAE